MKVFTRILVAIVAAPLPTLAVMFCAGRTDLMTAPVDVRFGCLVMGVVTAILALVLTDKREAA